MLVYLAKVRILDSTRVHNVRNRDRLFSVSRDGEFAELIVDCESLDYLLQQLPDMSGNDERMALLRGKRL
jgi:hypothetical protein